MCPPFPSSQSHLGSPLLSIHLRYSFSLPCAPLTHFNSAPLTHPNSPAHLFPPAIGFGPFFRDLDSNELLSMFFTNPDFMGMTPRAAKRVMNNNKYGGEVAKQFRQVQNCQSYQSKKKCRKILEHLQVRKRRATNVGLAVCVSVRVCVCVCVCAYESCA